MYLPHYKIWNAIFLTYETAITSLDCPIRHKTSPMSITTSWLNDESPKGHHSNQFLPFVRERLSKTWFEVDHCVAQFFTGYGNFNSKSYSLKLVVHRCVNSQHLILAVNS